MTLSSHKVLPPGVSWLNIKLSNSKMQTDILYMVGTAVAGVLLQLSSPGPPWHVTSVLLILSNVLRERAKQVLPTNCLHFVLNV